MSTSKIILNASFFSLNVATLSIKSYSSTSLTCNALKKHFEFRYYFDFSDSLNLLIINCMKSVIDFNQILKSRLYKKIIKTSLEINKSRSWKRKTIFFWLIKHEFWELFSKTNAFFMTNKFVKSKKTNATKFTLQYTINNTRFRANRKFELYKNVHFDDQVNE
jgi:hypothetical protein